MKEIHQLFFDLSLLLEEQGTQLDMIEVNVFLTVIKKDRYVFRPFGVMT